jgi:uncharacterized protein (TIRG00374 family)
MTKSLREFFTKYKSYIFLVLIVLLALKVIVPQLDDFVDSLKSLKNANLYWIAAGIIIYFTGILTLVVQVMALAFKPLAFGLTYKVEMAGQFVSKLLPSFVGVLTLNIYYLIKKSHTATQAATVMTANALASGVAYAILIIIGLTQSSVSFGNPNGSVQVPANLVLLLLILVAGLAYFLYRSIDLRKKIGKMWADIKANIRAYKQKPLSLVISVVCNGLGSAANIFAIFASAHAIGVDISFAQALIAYTFGNIAMSLIPTPGGLGAAEAGIYSGLVFTGINGADAMTITLLYRLISYWLPIIPGYIFFWGLRKNVLADFSFSKRYDT